MLTSVRYRWPAFVWLSILAVAPYACGGDADQSAPVPSAMTAVSGDAQTGTVGTALTQSLTVEVRDDAGQPVAGFTVSWSVASGGGSVSAASAQTGTNGQATTTWTLGGSAGAQTVTAAGSGLSVTFTATAEPGPPAQVGISGATTLTALEATTQLTGRVQDQFGNALAGDVTWASGDEAVATVAADGTVTARANGSANISATSGSLSGSATVTVAQEAATLAVAPANPVTTVGGTVQMSATAKDANGFDVAGDVEATWSSATTTVATIDAAGLATGVAEGQSVITATSGSATGTATLTVTAAPFEPNVDTTIDGDVSAERISIPAGVTVTLAADATLSSATTLAVEGTVVGECRGVTLAAGGDITISGTVNLACEDSTAAVDAPGVTLRGASVSVVGADILSDGEIVIETTGSASAASALQGGAAAAGDCLINQAALGSMTAGRPGRAAGGRVGGDGRPGRNVVVRCAGTMTLDGVVLRPGPGQYGGDGRSFDGGEARGGRGGDGGAVVLEAAAIVFRTEGSAGPVRFPGSVIYFGPGGFGGSGDSVGKDALAIGGAGGHAGLPRITAGTITIQGSQSLELRGSKGPTGDAWMGGIGGRADALGEHGADATATSAAEAGGPAEARGGAGGRLGNEGTTNLVGDIFVGTVENPGGIILLLEGLTSGPGGTGAAGGGNGGNGSEEFPAGAAGGDALATGGNAGAATLMDNRSGLPLGDGSAGGFLVFGHGGQLTRASSGGQGWSDCVVGGIKPGGAGGAAGRGQGSAGRGTTRAAPDQLGEWAVVSFGNGGNGGNGVAPGDGGAAANLDAVAARGDPERRIGTSLEAGRAGNPCATDMAPSIDVSSDPNGHAPFINMGATSSVTVTLGPDGTVQISGTGPWVTLQGTVQADGTFEVSGTGTVAGFAGVTVAMTGRLGLDADGRVTGIAEGTLIADSDNNVLPPNGDGVRNPTTYVVTGTASN